MSKGPFEDLYDLLQAARERPQMFVHGWSIDEIQMIFWAYRTALLVHGIREEFAMKFHAGFDRFLCDEYGWDTSRGWQSAIRPTVDTDEEAFNRFFELVDEFKLRHQC